jgi:hypothetical protein
MVLEGPTNSIRADVLELGIQHDREIVSFDRTRADSSESQAAATAAVAAAVAALAANAHPRFNGWLAVAAAFMLAASVAAVLARARFPPLLIFVKADPATYESDVSDAERALERAFESGTSVPDVRNALGSLWGAMAKRERVRATRKNHWLNVSLYGLLFELMFGVVGLFTGT